MNVNYLWQYTYSLPVILLCLAVIVGLIAFGIWITVKKRKGKPTIKISTVKAVREIEKLEKAVSEIRDRSGIQVQPPCTIQRISDGKDDQIPMYLITPIESATSEQIDQFIERFKQDVILQQSQSRASKG